MSEKKMRTKFYLKSGAVVATDLVRIEVKTTHLNTLHSVDWEHHPEVRERLYWADLTEIAAITVEGVEVTTDEQHDPKD